MDTIVKDPLAPAGQELRSLGLAQSEFHPELSDHAPDAHLTIRQSLMEPVLVKADSQGSA
jgi:hypothetical protein